MNPSLKGFRSHLDTEFAWSTWTHAARDGRGQQTRVSTGLMLTCLPLQVMRGLTSCLKLDQHLRLPYFVRALNHPRPSRGQGLFSDSTLFRCMQTLDDDWQRLFASHIARQLAQQGHLQYTLSNGRVIRPAMVDGSCFGGHWASVVAYAGNHGTYPVWLEPFNHYGQEFSTARTVRKRWFKHDDIPCPTHILLDGLYLKKVELSQWRALGIHPVIKTTQDNIYLTREVESLYQGKRDPLDYQSIDTAEYHDKKQRKTYRIWMISNMDWIGATSFLTVGRLEVTADRGHSEVYYAITTDRDLSAVELMEMARLRWHIENNAFKALNERVGSKKAYIKDETAKYSLLLVWFLGWCGVQTFLALCQTHLEPWCHSVKTTVHWFQALLLDDEIVESRGPPEHRANHNIMS